MTVEGGTTSAAAPGQRESRTLAVHDQPGVGEAEGLSPAIAAHPSRANAVLASELVHREEQPDSAKISIEEARPGRNAVNMSVPQAHAAIGPIHLSRVSGPIAFAKTGVATAAPSCVAAISEAYPATGPPPSLAA